MTALLSGCKSCHLLSLKVNPVPFTVFGMLQLMVGDSTLVSLSSMQGQACEHNRRRAGPASGRPGPP